MSAKFLEPLPGQSQECAILWRGFYMSEGVRASKPPSGSPAHPHCILLRVAVFPKYQEISLEASLDTGVIDVCWDPTRGGLCRVTAVSRRQRERQAGFPSSSFPGLQKVRHVWARSELPSLPLPAARLPHTCRRHQQWTAGHAQAGPNPDRHQRAHLEGNLPQNPQWAKTTWYVYHGVLLSHKKE